MLIVRGTLLCPATITWMVALVLPGYFEGNLHADLSQRGVKHGSRSPLIVTLLPPRLVNEFAVRPKVRKTERKSRHSDCFRKQLRLSPARSAAGLGAKLALFTTRDADIRWWRNLRNEPVVLTRTGLARKSGLKTSLTADVNPS